MVRIKLLTPWFDIPFAHMRNTYNNIAQLSDSTLMEWLCIGMGIANLIKKVKKNHSDF